MTGAAFTAGPWVANGNAIQTAEGEYVANLSSPRGAEQRERDARLIAAAPELYEACAEAILRCSMSDSMRRQLHAALAKARGEA